MADTADPPQGNTPGGAGVSFLLRDSFLYGGASAISKAFGLVTFPLLARHFSVSDYGVVDYFLVLANLLAVLFVFGQDSAVARYFYEYERAAERRQIVSQSLVFQLACMGLLLPAFWISSGLMDVLLGSDKGGWLFKLVLLQLPFLLLINFSRNLLKWTFRRTHFLVMTLGLIVIQSVVVVLCVIFLDLTISGVLLINLATSAFFGGLGLYFIRGWLERPRGLQFLREMLPFAVPYGIICVLASFSPALERTLALQVFGAWSLGLYAAGNKVAMFMALAVNAFQTAWGPFSLAIHRQPDAPLIYDRVLKAFTFGLCLLTILMELVARPAIHLMASEKYAEASVLVFPLALGLTSTAIGWITEIGISLSKRTHLALYPQLMAMLTTWAMVLLLAPSQGLLGMGLGVLAGQVVRASGAAWLAQRAYPLRWSYMPILGILTLTACSGFAAAWVGRRWGVQAHAVILIGGFSAVAAFGWSILLDRSDRGRAVAAIRGAWGVRPA